MQPENFGRVPMATLISLAEFRYHLRRFLSFSETVAERYDVGVQQYQLMQVIATAPAGMQTSISYLADRMVLRHNSTVELVDRAVKAGLVQRQQDPQDLRRSIVTLSEKGTSVLEEMVLEHLRDLQPRAEALINSLTELRSIPPVSPVD